jgi:hypothetical protein
MLATMPLATGSTPRGVVFFWRGQSLGETWGVVSQAKCWKSNAGEQRPQIEKISQTNSALEVTTEVMTQTAKMRSSAMIASPR